jgi:hypothetical protein
MGWEREIKLDKFWGRAGSKHLFQLVQTHAHGDAKS